MATDVRGHTVPAASDPPQRADLLRLSLSIPSLKTVSNATARAQYIADLAAESDPIIPSTSNPIYVFRTDAPAGAQIEYTTSSTGATWHTVTATPRTPYAMAAGACTGAISGAAVAISDTFPAGLFTVAPIVVPSMVGIAGFTSTLRVAIQTVSTSGVTFFVNSTAGASVSGTVSLQWIATQMTSTTAAS